MNTEEMKKLFEKLIAAQPDKDKQDIIKLVMLYFTDDTARQMISDMVWQANQQSA